jgi:hypothetical protein
MLLGLTENPFPTTALNQSEQGGVEFFNARTHFQESLDKSAVGNRGIA